MKGKTCSKCQGNGPFAKMCSSKCHVQGGKKPVRQDKQRIDAVESNNSEHAFAVNSHNPSTLEVTVGRRILNMLIDSGASINMMSAMTWEKVKREGVECSSRTSSDKKLFPYASDKPLPVNGTFTCDVKSGRRMAYSDFPVVKGNSVPRLGQDTAMQLGALKIDVNIASVQDEKQKV